MKRRCAITLIDLMVPVVFYLLLVALLISVFTRARDNARRSSCHSNQKQIVLAFMQYARDSDDHLPQHQWVKPLVTYTKTDAVFQCPQGYSGTGQTTDYFWNARFFGRRVADIKSPNTLIVLGDGTDNAPHDASLNQLPTAWLTDQSSPAWRHLKAANYCFADGHVKTLKATRINSYFRMVNP